MRCGRPTAMRWGSKPITVVADREDEFVARCDERYLDDGGSRVSADVRHGLLKRSEAGGGDIRMGFVTWDLARETRR